MDAEQIIAGPILRRVLPTQVNIWLATVNHPATIRASLYHYQKDPENPLIEVPTEPQTLQTVRVASECYIHLLTIQPVDPLPKDEILCYDLHFTVGNSTKNLTELGLVESGENQTPADAERVGLINLKGLPLPSFVIPAQLTNYLHGSCFKFHGKGTEAFSNGEQIVQQWALDVDHRPACLFLTGDQIYGDDVATKVLNEVLDFGKRLGFQEYEAEWLTSNRRYLKVGQRWKLFTKEPLKVSRVAPKKPRPECVFTSTEASNHLVALSDYLAMYLLAWNPANWKNKEYYDSLKIRGHAIRRLLANVPTYMLFDDHEITDDWNLGARWEEEARAHPIGRRVMANGLAAFFLCQGWGNQPDAFTRDFLDAITPYLDNIHAPTPEQADTFEKTLLDFQKWSFAVPTSPPIIALDTRTCRDHKPGVNRSGLMNQEAFDQLLDHWNQVKQTESGTSEAKEAILLSPVPVLGNHTLDDLKFGSETWMDMEHWSLVEDCYQKLMVYLGQKMQLSRCIILSGDVHYSFAYRGLLSIGEHTTVLQQFTCSALQNASGNLQFFFYQEPASNRRQTQDHPIRPTPEDKLPTVPKPPVAKEYHLGAALLKVQPYPCEQKMEIVPYNSIGLIQDCPSHQRIWQHALAKDGKSNRYSWVMDDADG